MYVNSGLLLAEEDRLAGVMAHEIAHAAARYWASQVTPDDLASVRHAATHLHAPVLSGLSGRLAGIELRHTADFSQVQTQRRSRGRFSGPPVYVQGGLRPRFLCGIFRESTPGRTALSGQRSKNFSGPPAHAGAHPEVQINEVLPKRHQYLVSTSGFDDVRARLSTVVSGLRKQQKPGPTLAKREVAGGSTRQTDAD